MLKNISNIQNYYLSYKYHFPQTVLQTRRNFIEQRPFYS